MHKSLFGATYGIVALFVIAFMTIPATSQAAKVRYNFTGKVASQSGSGILIFGDRLGETVQITATLDLDRLNRSFNSFSMNVPQIGGGTASFAMGTSENRSFPYSHSRFLTVIARFADGAELEVGSSTSGRGILDQQVTISNDIVLPGSGGPTDTLFVSSGTSPYYNPFSAFSISIMSHLSPAALTSSAFGEIPLLSPNDVVTATLRFDLAFFDDNPEPYRASSTTVIDVFAIDALPEPQTYILFLAGLLGVGGIARRRATVKPTKTQ